jgi:SHS2 domain-containing protein
MTSRMTEWRDAKGRSFPRIEAVGSDLSEAFREAAQVFFSHFTDLGKVRPSESVVVFCESSDSDWLFSDWINSLIYEVRERGMLFSEFRIVVDGINVKGEILGERIDPTRHVLLIEELAGAAFDELYAREAESSDAKATVSAVLNDFARHSLPLRGLWSKSASER